MQAVVACLATLLIRLLRLTWRVRLVGPDPEYASGPLIFCFWHGRQAGLLAHPRPRTVVVLSSLSRDGSLQTRILTRLGFRVVRGSSSRGGAAGLKALVDAVRGGADAAFALDGPRGPAGVPKPGAIAAARQTGASLIPMTSRASRAWVFDEAWDRYRLPKPFARVELARAAAIPVGGARADDLDAAVTGALAELERQAPC